VPFLYYKGCFYLNEITQNIIGSSPSSSANFDNKTKQKPANQLIEGFLFFRQNPNLYANSLQKSE